MSDARGEMRKFWGEVITGTRIGILVPILSPGICEECGKEVAARWPWKDPKESPPRFLCGLCRWVSGGKVCIYYD